MSTGIPYIDETWNVSIGCTRVSPGCDNCWAFTYYHRFRKRLGLTDVVGESDWTGKIKTCGRQIPKPFLWKRPRRILVNATSDLFHELVPIWFLKEVFDIVRQCPQHTFLGLTKRAGRAAKLAKYTKDLENWWAGITVEDQKTANERIPVLCSMPAKHRWISIEPLLGEINLEKYLTGSKVGIESGYEYTNKSQASRRKIDISSSNKGIGNRRQGQDMENCQAGMGQMEQAGSIKQMQTSSGGETIAERLYAGPRNVEQETYLRTSKPLGMEAFQWPDTVRANNKSQERNQERQQAEQSGDSNIRRTSKAFDLCSGEQSTTTEPDRREKPKLQINEQANRANPNDLRKGEIDAKRFGGEIRSGISNNIKNSQGGEPSEAVGGICGLHISAKTQPYISRPQRPISFCVIGCESGPGRRPCALEWVRNLVRQCSCFGIPVYIKQLDINGKCNHNIEEWPRDLQIQEQPR